MGGAVGDALGSGIEFQTIEQIRADHGPDGVTGLTGGYGHLAPLTDDTQMTLFTAEGLIRASVRSDRGICHPPSVVWHAYLRWLTTQGERPQAEIAGDPGWLVGNGLLHARRAPGNACLSGLRSRVRPTREVPVNPDSKGCGTVMRSAPFGWLPWDPDRIWSLTGECAALTHGHPTAREAASAFAVLVHHLIGGSSLVDGLEDVLGRLLAVGAEGAETHQALTRARELAVTGVPPGPEQVARLGQGWVAEEALAIAVYCALACEDPAAALLAAVNHSGDSDSTGAITGNLVGAACGDLALPLRWVIELEGRGLLLQVADDFVYEFTRGTQLHGDSAPLTGWVQRYPGC